jgi:Telomere resolvase
LRNWLSQNPTLKQTSSILGVSLAQLVKGRDARLRPHSPETSQRSIRKKPRTLNAAYHERIHQDQSNLIPLDPEAFIQTALELLVSDRYLQKGMGLMALTGRRPAEIFFSASFSLPDKNSPSRPPL